MFRTEQNKTALAKSAIPLLAVAMLLLGSYTVHSKAMESHTVSWYAWLMGQSVSFEFHFLDLLELLSRSKSTDDA